MRSTAGDGMGVSVGGTGVTVGGTRVAVGSGVDVLVGGTKVAVGSGVDVLVGGTRVAVGSGVDVLVGGKGVGLDGLVGVKAGKGVTLGAAQQADSDPMIINAIKSSNALFSTVIFSSSSVSYTCPQGTRCSNKRWYRTPGRSCLPSALVAVQSRV